MPVSFSHFTTAAVNADLNRYRRFLASEGKVLDSTQQDKIFQFASGLYTGAGRQDFWLFDDLGIGDGPTAYSFHLKTATLINGPTWVADGLKLERASAQSLSANTSQFNPQKTYNCAIFAGVKDDASLSGLMAAVINNTVNGPRVELAVDASGRLACSNKNSPHGGENGTSAYISAGLTAGSKFFGAGVQTATALESNCNGLTNTGVLKVPSAVFSPVIYGFQWNTQATAYSAAWLQSNTPFQSGLGEYIRQLGKATIWAGKGLP